MNRRRTRDPVRKVKRKQGSRRGYPVALLVGFDGAHAIRSILFSLKEIEEVVYDRERNDDSRMKCLLLTDKYRADTEDKNKIHRLLRISKNHKVKTRIVNAETLVGKRISQFGGVVFFSMSNHKLPLACV